MSVQPIKDVTGGVGGPDLLGVQGSIPTLSCQQQVHVF